MTLSPTSCSTPSPPGAYHDPHSVLGIHPGTDAEGGDRVDRSAPGARSRASVTAVFADGTRVPLEHVRAGIWEGTRSGDRAAATSS